MSSRLNNMNVGEIRAIARTEAEEILDLHWEARVFPVDPVVIARELGLSVFNAELGEDVSGMIVGQAGDISIYLDYNQPSSRYRFTCAHEIGHYVDRSDDLLAGGAIVDRRSEAGRGSPDEIYANEFAAALLMPETEFRDAFECGKSDLAVSSYFGTSLPAVQLRKRYLKVES